MLLEGIFLPVVTPFYPDGRVYLRKLEHNVDRYSRTPAAGMVVLGSASEADGLTDTEACEVLGSAIALAAKEKMMLAGVGRESVFATLALAEAAAAAGYDAVVVRGPAFSGDWAMLAEVRTYFAAVADRSPLPVVLLSEAGRRVPVDAVVELAEHSRVVGVIAEEDTAWVAEVRGRTAGVSREVTVTTTFGAVTGRMLREVAQAGAATFVSAAELVSASAPGGGGAAVAIAPPVPALKTRTKRVGFQVLGGNALGMLEAWGAGASGAVPRVGACTPQGCCEVWQAFRDGDAPLAAEKQERLRAVAGMMEGPGAIGRLKYGCDWNGYFGGRPRLPLLGPTGEEREAVEHALGGLRN